MTSEHLERITDEVWRTTVGLLVARTAAVPAHEWAEPVVSSCVHITGSWEGTVVLCMGKRLASLAAATMFAVDATEVTEDEIQDAIGELVNVIGGNVKALAPESSRISLPAVVVGSDYRLLVPGTHRSECLEFEHGGLRLRVSLLARTATRVAERS
jgi:chemotaxis protein CheX